MKLNKVFGKIVSAVSDTIEMSDMMLALALKEGLKTVKEVSTSTLIELDLAEAAAKEKRERAREARRAEMKEE